MENIIVTKNLSKKFGTKEVVKRLNLTVKKGQIFGFLGPNGSGKTTSIRMMCGLLTPSSGAGTCLGYDILTMRKSIKNHVGYMPQKFSLYSDLSVKENMMFMASMYGVKAKRVEELADEFQLKRFFNQLASSLSGGWKQRLAIACCLLNKPKLIFLDEPTAGIDPSARSDFWSVLNKLASEGTTILIATHYMDEANRCNNLAYIFNGRLLAAGKPAEIVSAYELTSIQLKGDNLIAYSEHFARLDKLKLKIEYGEEIRLITDNPESLLEQLTQFKKAHNLAFEYKNKKIDLEEAFIYLMKQSPDEND